MYAARVLVTVFVLGALFVLGLYLQSCMAKNPVQPTEPTMVEETEPAPSPAPSEAVQYDNGPEELPDTGGI